jgi:hypothetical protein
MNPRTKSKSEYSQRKVNDGPSARIRTTFSRENKRRKKGKDRNKNTRTEGKDNIKKKGIKGKKKRKKE